MGNTQNKLEKDLRAKVTRFLAGGSPRQALLEITDRIRGRNWDAVLFGGTLRDLMLYGGSHLPRDVDIVIAGVPADQIATLFSDCIIRQTRFGGLHLRHKGWLFDVWPLADTWAFKSSNHRQFDFEDLPKTTFLNVEAVVADLTAKPGRARKIRANGFFEAITEQILDINNEENPFPTLCVVRTLITAARLQFSISRRLCKYLLHYSKTTSAEELVYVQLKHYGTCKRTAEEFHAWLEFIRVHHRSGATKRVILPVRRPQQLEFSEWTPAW